jgi:hypothetical protein
MSGKIKLQRDPKNNSLKNPSKIACQAQKPLNLNKAKAFPVSH